MDIIRLSSLDISDASQKVTESAVTLPSCSEAEMANGHDQHVLLHCKPF